MSKTSKALKRRGNGVKVRDTVLPEPVKTKPKKNANKKKTSLHELVEAGHTITDQDIGIHPSEGP